MPDTRRSLAPGQLTAHLTATLHGPYDDTATAAAAGLAAECIRYLCYAGPRGGITEPATIAAVTTSLTVSAYRLPQFLSQLSDWLTAETAAGRIADDQHRPASQITDAARDIVAEAAEHAASLAVTLTAAANLTATLHTA
jgi:hypothetical protein